MIRTFLAIALATIAAPALAAPNCAERAVVLDELATKYRETRRAMGLAANNTMMELFASDDTGTWTLTVTLPNGTTCLVASGERFESLTEALPPGGVEG